MALPTALRRPPLWARWAAAVLFLLLLVQLERRRAGAPPSTSTASSGSPDRPKEASVRAPLGQVEGTEKAAFVVLVRERELQGILRSIRQLEQRFNHRYHYPWIFLNEEAFSDNFKHLTSAAASGSTEYGLVPDAHWVKKGFPSTVDADLARERMEEAARMGMPYGGSLSYRKMCRYQSGFFWRHPLLEDLEYYWRVEPNVNFFCDTPYDPFRLMKEQGKQYGFTISLYENRETIPTLWETTMDFVRQNEHFLARPNLMEWVSDDGNKTYNGCHFWSNFEIASLSLFRSAPYRAFFAHLDRTGGFFYERWGDAPVHSIAAALFLRPDEVHFFEDVGYGHAPYQHCPKKGVGTECACDPAAKNSWEFSEGSCTPNFKRLTHWTSISDATDLGAGKG
ncbi:hypothetical protein JCM6882_006250 [Rhodosporidiobolus microsporus]